MAAELEILFLLGPVLLIKHEFALVVSRGNRLHVNAGLIAPDAGCNTTGAVLCPFLPAGKHRELKAPGLVFSVCILLQLHTDLPRLWAIKRERRQEIHILKFHRAFHRSPRDGAGNEFKVSRSRNQRLAGFEPVFGDERLAQIT